MKIAFITVSAYCAFPFKSDTSHISVNTVVTQAECGCQLFAAQQFAIFHIWALQNIYPVMLAVGFDFLELETCIFVEYSANHLMENLKEKRTEKWDLGCNMQAFSIRLYTDSYGFFYQGDSLSTRDIFNHLKINSRPWEYHSFGMYLFLFRQSFIFVA